MQKQKIHPGTILTFFFSLAALEAFASAIYLLVLPADPKNRLILGYSLPRLIILGIFLLLLLTFSILAVKTRANRVQAEDRLARILSRKNVAGFSLICSTVLFWIGWIICLTPPYRFAELATYYLRLQPVFIWITLFCAQIVLLLLFYRYGIHSDPLRNELKASRAVLLAGSIPLAGGLLIWLAVAVLGFGIVSDSIFWNETGVPILAIQVLLAWGVGAAVILTGIRIKSGQQGQNKASFMGRWGGKTDWLVFILIWVLAAVLWIREPMPSSYFSPAPSPPTYERYPYSDAWVYDLTAQDALIGQLYNNHQYVDKPLYTAFLTLLHTIAGNNFDLTIDLQVIVLALFPAILYLIGKAIYNRAIAIVVALLAIFQEVNSIAATRMLQVSDSRLFLTEVPTALLLALFVLWMVGWFTQPARRGRYLILAGGTLGLATLLRHNVLLLIPLAILILLANQQLLLKLRFQSILLFSLFFLLSITPWVWRSTVVQHNPIYFSSAISQVVWKNRVEPLLELAYPKVKKTPKPAPAQSTPNPAATAKPTVVSGLKPTPPAKKPADAALNPSKETSDIVVKQLGLVGRYVTAHYLHNLITSVLILPGALQNDDLPHLIQPAGSYWDINWKGSLTAGGALLLFINLVLIGLGAGLAWSKKKLAGWIPLIIFLVYNLATAIARTSGGRYIVPVEWVIYFYYAAGLIQVTVWLASLFKWDQNLQLRSDVETKLASDIDQGPKRLPVWQTALVVLALLSVAISVPLLERLFPVRYPDGSQAALESKMQQEGIYGKIKASGLDVSGLVTSSAKTLSIGRALYPTYYHGTMTADTAPAGSKDPPNISRLEFSQIGPRGNITVVLPVTNPQSVSGFKNNSDVLVVGCRNDKYHDIEAAAVVVLGTSDTVYLRSPAQPLVCPAN
ncbi:MAG: glycosyltransferase family 39 protein [Anaerolineaceae bacterium]|nr:glycosyltransferase family 39 protein [Anaerolineaceae bacterium]